MGPVPWLVLAALASAPSSEYRDSKGRFRLEVAESFELEPRFGDVDGARFVAPEPKRRGGGPVTFEVRIREAGACAAEGGETVRVEGRAWRRSDAGAVFYRRDFGLGCLEVRVEGQRRARRRLRREIEAMLGSLRRVCASPFARVRGSASDEGCPERGGRSGGQSRSPEPSDRASLVGLWVDPSGARLALAPSGRFALGSVEGAWRLERGELVLVPEGRAPRRFAPRLEGDVLVLAGGGLPRATRYRRARLDSDAGPAQRGASPPPEAQRRREASRLAEAPSDPEARLPGVWRAGALVLELEPGGAFALGPWSGRWRVEGARLRLEKSPVDILDYRFRLEGAERLVLGGADLDAPLVFERARGGDDEGRGSRVGASPSAR